MMEAQVNLKVRYPGYLGSWERGQGGSALYILKSVRALRAREGYFEWPAVSLHRINEVIYVNSNVLCGK